MSDESLIQQCRELFHHTDLPHHTYEDYCRIVCQAGKIYLQLLGDYLAHVPDDEVAKRTETISRLMLEIQLMLL